MIRAFLLRCFSRGVIQLLLLMRIIHEDFIFCCGQHYILLIVFHRDTLMGYQASPRGGTVGVTVGQGAEGNRVTLKGEAVTVFRGLFRR